MVTRLLSWCSRRILTAGGLDLLRAGGAWALGGWQSLSGGFRVPGPGLTPPAPIALILPYPPAQGLGRTPHLRRDRLNGRPLRSILRLVLLDQPHRPFPNLRGVPRSFVHGSNLSNIGASGNPGAVHGIVRAAIWVLVVATLAAACRAAPRGDHSVPSMANNEQGPRWIPEGMVCRAACCVLPALLLLAACSEERSYDDLHRQLAPQFKGESTGVVALVDPAVCLACDQAAQRVVELRRITPVIRIALARTPTELERRRLVLTRVAIDWEPERGADYRGSALQLLRYSHRGLERIRTDHYRLVLDSLEGVSRRAGGEDDRTSQEKE